MIASLLISLLAQALEPQTVEMDVLREGEIIGEARIGYEITPRGEKLSRFELTSTSPEARIRQETTWGSDGAPVRILYSVASESQPGTSILVDFSQQPPRYSAMSESGARSGFLSTRDRIANPTEFWFLTSVPKQDERFTYFSLQLPDMEWVQRTIIYKGRVRTAHAGEEEAHHVTIDGQNVYYDDAGLPWRIESGAYVLQRKGNKVVSGLQ